MTQEQLINVNTLQTVAQLYWLILISLSSRNNFREARYLLTRYYWGSCNDNYTGTHVDVSTIWRFLHLSNITRQKMVLVTKWISERSIPSRYSDFHEMLIFVDETGADIRNCLRRFGYSIRGKPPVSKKLLIRGQRVNAIAASGVFCNIVCGDGDRFIYFVQNILFPHLQPFDGVNPHSVVHPSCPWCIAPPTVACPSLFPTTLLPWSQSNRGRRINIASKWLDTMDWISCTPLIFQQLLRQIACTGLNMLDTVNLQNIIHDSLTVIVPYYI